MSTSLTSFSSTKEIEKDDAVVFATTSMVFTAMKGTTANYDKVYINVSVTINA